MIVGFYVLGFVIFVYGFYVWKIVVKFWIFDVLFLVDVLRKVGYLVLCKWSRLFYIWVFFLLLYDWWLCKGCYCRYSSLDYLEEDCVCYKICLDFWCGCWGRLFGYNFELWYKKMEWDLLEFWFFFYKE